MADQQPLTTADPDEVPESEMRPDHVAHESDDETEAPADDQVQQGLQLLADDASGETLTAFQQLGKARLPANVQCKTLGGPLLFNNVFTAGGWRVQQHKVTGLCRVLNPANVRVAWGSLGALRRTFCALLQLKGLASAADAALAAKGNKIDMVAIPEEDLGTWQERVADMERGVKHPLGTDTFETHHGADYFAFFRRMGRVHCFVGLHNDRVVSLANGVLRTIPLRPGKKPKNVWRLGDLKVRPEYRGQGLSTRMLRTFVPDQYHHGSRAYLVTMNPGDGSRNAVVHLLQKIPFQPFKPGPRLLFYSLSHAEVTEALPAIAQHRGPVTFLSLEGVKDIVLTSTGRPMPLLHLQFGPLAAPGALPAPREGHVHMLCTPEGDALAAALAAYPVAATATVMHHDMAKTDWTWVLTSEV